MLINFNVLFLCPNGIPSFNSNLKLAQPVYKNVLMDFFFPSISYPISVSIVSLCFISYSTIKIIRFKKQISSLKLGRDGEKAIAEYLSRFREKGYRIFNDLIIGDYNIDHVLIGEKGIYTIETKTISNYRRRKQNIQYDGKSLKINGYEMERNPIIQAKAQAKCELEGDVVIN